MILKFIDVPSLIDQAVLVQERGNGFAIVELLTGRLSCDDRHDGYLIDRDAISDGVTCTQSAPSCFKRKKRTMRRNRPTLSAPKQGVKRPRTEVVHLFTLLGR